ncbi:MAG: 3-deoxy-D-manno-octulosonic acid transferase [Desulfobacterota bacterium]|nr:3-deoxy-D-manno-octulosonic acid transferase [Thermodesulfobacteriota bacterium]
MMYAIYNLMLLVLAVILSPVIIVLVLSQHKYRTGFLEKCTLSYPILQLHERPLWIHAVSVGEVMAAAPLIREIKRWYPRLPVIVSTITVTGNLTARRNLKKVDGVIFFPYDYPVIVKRCIKRIRPRAFIALETEIWPNMLRELNRHGIPAMIVSGRISERSYKNYYLFRFFFRRVLAYVACCCMQSEGDAQRIIAIGADPTRVVVTGNVKFDLQIPPISEHEHRRLRDELKIQEQQPVIIAGSTHRGEEELFLEIFKTVKQRFPDALLILAPRHPERFDEVATLLQRSGMHWHKRTLLATHHAATQPTDIIMLDTIGELAKIYSLGTVIFIGGSLVPVGGHNVLEPGVFKKPVVFGPFMENFAEIARILTERHAACQVQNKEECASQILRLLEDPDLRARIGNAAFRVIEENTGAVARSLAMIEKTVGKL